MTLLVIYALFASVSTLSLSTVIWPKFESQAREHWKNLQTSWPNELRFEYIDGKLHANSSETFTVPYLKFFPRQTGWPEYFVQIDIDQAEPPTDSLIFINSDSVTTRTSGVPRSLPLKELLGETSWSLDKTAILNLDDEFTQFVNEARVGVTIAWFFFSWAGLLLFRLAGLLLYAWIIQTIYTFLGIRLQFWQSYGLGMLVLLPAEVVQTLSNILFPASPPFFWWVWLGFALLVGWLNRRRF